MAGISDDFINFQRIFIIAGYNNTVGESVPSIVRFFRHRLDIFCFDIERDDTQHESEKTAEKIDRIFRSQRACRDDRNGWRWDCKAQ